MVSARPLRGVYMVAGVMVLVAGAALRIQQYLSNRSVWLDEALLVNNIVRRDYVELLDPLNGDQGAPVLFLWLERSAVIVGGNNELALRFLPLLAGLATLPVAYLLGRRLTSRAGGLVALVLVALSPALIRYSTEIKQYATDALLCTLALLLAVAWLDGRSPRTLGGLALLGTVGIWLSHPLALVLAGVGLVLFVDALSRREVGSTAGLVVVGCAWAVSAGAAYLVSLRDLRANEVLESYWLAGYPPRDASITDVAAWIPNVLGELGQNPGHLRWPALGGAVVAIGTWSLARRAGVARTAVMVAPFVAVLVAAAVRAYPFSGRLILFLVPIAAVLAAAAVTTRRWTGPLAAALLLVVTSPWWGDAVDVASDPLQIAELRPVLAHVEASLEPGDRVYVHGTAVAPYAYYAHRSGVPAHQRTVWLDAEQCADPPPPLQLLGATAMPGERVWIVFAYTLSGRTTAAEAERVRAEFDEIGRRLDLFTAHDASAALYLVGAGGEEVASGGSVESRADPRFSCLGVRAIDPVPRSGLSTGPLGTGRQT